MDGPAPRSLEQRKRDVLTRFEHDVDTWVSTASVAGEPCLVPLSFLWHADEIIIATEDRSPTMRNLRVTPSVRLGFGLTRDVVLMSGTVRLLPASEVADELGDAFAIKAGFDPRDGSGAYSYAFVRPLWIRAWREVDELAERDVMRDGVWL